jgi:flagellar hook protein FlgE
MLKQQFQVHLKLVRPVQRALVTFLSGSLERSNVDITEELVNLITAQRNFQASAKAIETTTTLTQSIVNIRM